MASGDLCPAIFGREICLEKCLSGHFDWLLSFDKWLVGTYNGGVGGYEMGMGLDTRHSVLSVRS